MTRINSAIHPSTLSDQHLIAELRELPRIFTAVKKRNINKIPFDDIPPVFKLGNGHVKFFYNKTNFLLKRHNSLREEYKKRFNKIWQYIPDFDYIENQNDYIPTIQEFNLLKERISERILNSKQIPRYYSEIVNGNDLIKKIYFYEN